MSREDRFQQPTDAIEIVKKAKGPRTLLPDSLIEIGRERVAAGEDVKEVAKDLAMHEASLLPMEEE